MIEQLIEAERALSFGLVDQAERLYRSVAEHDPRNSIAVVGLARVAIERGDDQTAYIEARRALDIDPDNPAARNMVIRLEEVMQVRGEELPEVGAAQGVAPDARAARDSKPAAPATPPASGKRSMVDRLLGRGR